MDGTWDDSNLASSTVKSGITFATSSTGVYPSANYPLSGDTVTTDATASEICSDNEAWSKTGSVLTGSLSMTAAYIASSTTYCGVEGTLLGNMFNGTGQGLDGGTQASGGVDDYNNGGAAPTDRYSKGWTACTSGADNYCDTGDAFADIKDDSTGLIWSKPCSGSGCASSAEPADTVYTWNNSGGNNNSLTAYQLCSQDLGTTHDEGWFLPHQKQLMQAYIDGSYGNLDTFCGSRYWSATSPSDGLSSAWFFTLCTGYSSATVKSYNGYWVRCVRSAP